jgi:hypothetical protein
MARHRAIAGSPARTAGETWATISTLVADTLGKSSSITESAVTTVMNDLSPAGLALVASGHLQKHPLTVVAEPLYLTITTVEGEEAFSAMDEENLSPVPGATTATTWKVYLPSPVGLSDLVAEVVAGSEHASAASPPSESVTKEASASNGAFDLRRLDPKNRD